MTNQPKADPITQQQQLLTAVALYTIMQQQREAQARHLATTTKGARTDPFCLVLQGDLRTDMVPR